jgi:hypothetical protein
LHIYFDLLQKKILNEIQQDYGQRKNHWVDDRKESQFWPWNEKKMR